MPYVIPRPDAAAALAALDGALGGADSASASAGAVLRYQLVGMMSAWGKNASATNDRATNQATATAAFSAGLATGQATLATAMTAADRDIRRLEERLVVHGVAGSPPFAPSTPSTLDPTNASTTWATLATRLSSVELQLGAANLSVGGLATLLAPELSAAKIGVATIRVAAERPVPSPPSLPFVAAPDDVTLDAVVARVNEFVASLGWT